MPYRLVTNTSSRTRDQIAALLADAGMVVDPAWILTAVTAADRLLGERHPEATCLVVNDGDLATELPSVRAVTSGPADVVLLGGAGPFTSYDRLNQAFRLADAGAPVIALHRNTRYQTADGPALDMGAFIVGLEAATGAEVEVVGKPSAAFFGAALGDLGVEAEGSVMVGDDIGSDIGGAQRAGMVGVLVRTGKFRPSDLEGAVQPDEVIDGIGDLPAFLERHQ